MNTYARKLLVILAEAVLEKTLVEDARRLGAQGYTIVDARGGGRHGEREGEWQADRCIHMEIICDEATAQALAEHIRTRYFAHYGISLYFADVGVLRPGKFCAGGAGQD
jgi:hypothetical protein